MTLGGWFPSEGWRILSAALTAVVFLDITKMWTVFYVQDHRDLSDGLGVQCSSCPWQLGRVIVALLNERHLSTRLISHKKLTFKAITFYCIFKTCSSLLFIRNDFDGVTPAQKPINYILREYNTLWEFSQIWYNIGFLGQPNCQLFSLANH